MSVFITFAAALLIFGAVIAIHEFGHFAMAKLCGVQVNEFSIGMGPALIKTYRKGGLGSYHIEYEYYLSGKSGFYPWTRQAINAVHRSENEEEVPNE